MVRCYSGYSVCGEATVCLGSASVFDKLVVETGNPVFFYSLYRELKRVEPVVRKLVRLFKFYDLQQLVSTHAAMTRRVARLRKLMRILGSLELKVVGCNGTCIVSFLELARPVAELVDDVIDLMEYYRGAVHRERDRVHTYLYPILLSLLDALKDGFTLVLNPYNTAVPRIEFTADTMGGIDVVIDSYDVYYSGRVSEKVFERLGGDCVSASRRLGKILDTKIVRLRRRRRRRAPATVIPWGVLHAV